MEDALNATKAAVEEGIVPGGGAALLHATKELHAVKESLSANFDQQIGVQIIINALKVPMRTIASNAGAEGAVVVGKVEEMADTQMGYNAATGQYEDMIKAGVVDPVKVVRTALLDAASVSSLITTSECVIVEAPKEDKMGGMGGMGGGGMGGMGGMGDMY